MGTRSLKALVLLILLGIWAGAALNAVAELIADDVRQRLVREDFRDLAPRVESYWEATGKYPTSEQGFTAMVKKPETNQSPERWKWMISMVPIDAWGTRYGYRLLPGGSSPAFEIISAGPDGIFGNKDDLASLEL